MTSRRLLFFHLLLFIHLACTAYIYFENELKVNHLSVDHLEYHTKIKNPLQIIFAGSESTGETAYIEHKVPQRTIRLIRLMEMALIVIAIGRYFISRQRKTGTLLFSLILTFWLSVAGFVYRPVYFIWLKVHPEWPIVAVHAGWELLYLVLPRFIALIFMISTLKRIASSEAASCNQDLLPLTWMRGFHALADRLSIVAIGFNMFVWFYYSAVTDKWHPIEVPQDVLRDWSIFSLLIAFLIAYLVSEGFFQLSPFKALTGTEVVRTRTAQSPSWLQIIGRSLSRSIPFNEFSFIFGHGWHDRISRTTLHYTSTESWLSRTSRLVRSFFIFYLFIAAWALITTAFQTGHWGHRYQIAAALPQALLFCVFPIVAALFICYIAALSNLGQNIQASGSTHSATHFLSAMLCWVPVFNYAIPGRILYEASYNIASHDAALAEKYNRHTRILCRLFGLAYTFMLPGLAGSILARTRNDVLAGEILMGVGAIIWSIATINYSGQLKSLEMNAMTPETQQIIEI